MLMIPARARPSPIHGLGLFAERDIAPDELIWVFHAQFDLVLAEADLSGFPGHTQDFIRRYATFAPANRSFYLSSDDDRFTNHSSTPNTYLIDGSVFARVAIHQGDEITADYGEIGMLVVP
jgi:uncharacterized protein